MSGGMPPHILNFDPNFKWVVSFTPQPPYPLGKSSQYILNKKPVSPRACLDALEWSLLLLPGIEPRFLRRLGSSRLLRLSKISWKYSSTSLYDASLCGAFQLYSFLVFSALASLLRRWHVHQLSFYSLFLLSHLHYRPSSIAHLIYDSVNMF